MLQVRTPPQRLSDERKLQLTAGLVLLCLGSLTLLSIFALRSSTLERIHAGLGFAARMGGRQASDLVQTRLNNMQAYLELPVFRAAVLRNDCAEMSKRLRLLAEHDPYVERATVTDGRGRYLCSVPTSAEDVVGTDLSDMDWYRGSAGQGRPYVSQVFRRRLPPQHLVVVLAVPLVEHGKTQALLALLLDLDALGGIGSASGGDSDRQALLIDPAGQWAGAGRLSDERRLGAYGAVGLVQDALKGQGGHGEFIDPLSGSAHLAAAVPVTLTGRSWAVLVMQDSGEALAPLRRLYWRLGLGGLAALAVAFGGLWVLLRSRRQAARLAAEMERQNEELAMQSEELEQANEELQQQSEELQQQSEELGRTNQELEALRQGLEAKVAQRGQELVAKEAQFQQAQKLESIGRLAGGVAHDFNNLLTVVLGYVDLLKKAPQDAALREQGLVEIGQAAERGAQLTHQLLAFARRQMLEARPLSLAELVDSLMPLLRRLTEASIEITARHQSTPLQVRADRTQMEQVLMNLCINARDAMPKGGRIDISTELAELAEAIGEGDERLPAGRYLLLQVRDSGEGMAPEVLAKAFEPFFTTKEVGRGSGLGLSMVHGAIRQAGGQIYAYSRPGQGTVFKAYLPAIDPSGAAAPAREAPAPAGGHEGILLAEDNAALRGLAARSLRQAGYQVMEASDSAEALQALRAGAAGVQLLISDLVMPGGSGLDLARQAAAQQPGLRVLFISGYSDVELPGPGERLLWAFLPKPFHTADLLRRVRELLDRRP